MAIKRKAFASQAETLGDRQVRVICSTAEVDRVGEIVVQEGLDLGPYLDNPVVLWQHDPEQPIARAVSVELVDGCVMALVQFPPEGVSCKADEVYGLVKAGILNTVSIGFDPTTVEPIDPVNPKGPLKYLSAELLEISFVSIPANRGAAVVARQHRKPAAKVKSLYDVGQAAYLLEQMGWLQSSAQYEADFEEDASKVPAMLGQAMQQFGAALIAMTEEEVAELMAQADAEPETVAAEVSAEDADFVEAGKTAAIRKFRAGLRLIRRAKPGVVTKGARALAMRERARRKRDMTIRALG